MNSVIFFRKLRTARRLLVAKCRSFGVNLGQTHYAKITFPQFSNADVGKRFKVYDAGRLVWGTEIERPQVGFPLEYRNILVSSSSPSSFTVEPKLPFEIEVSDRPFSTPEQDQYDAKYRVAKHPDGLWYALRGNATNPKYLLLTFPGFGPSTSRISYAVSFMSQIKDRDLKETLLVAFQDRYQVHGTYMVTDDNGQLLYPRFAALVRSLARKYSIAPENVIFFGASKGASIALMYARDFPKAHLVTVVPQVHLRYYLQSKPFFRNNLFHYFKMVNFVEPIKLLRRYFHEGREIHYFYTVNDELSNYSLIERVAGVPNLTRVRVDGTHGEVATKALQTVLSLIARFTSRTKDGKGDGRFELAYCDAYQDQGPTKDRTGWQVGLPNSLLSAGDCTAYLRASAGCTRFLQMLSSSGPRTVWYTNQEQLVDPSADNVGPIDSVAVFTKDGRQFQAELAQDPGGTAPGTQQEYDPNELLLDAEAHSYWVVQGDDFGRFAYRFHKAGSSNQLSVVCRDHLAEKTDVSCSTLAVSSLDQWQGLAVLLSRVMKQAQLTTLSLDVEVSAHLSAVLGQATQIDLPTFQATVRNPRLDDWDHAHLAKHDLIPTLTKHLSDKQIRVVTSPGATVDPLFRPYTAS